MRRGRWGVRCARAVAASLAAVGIPLPVVHTSQRVLALQRPARVLARTARLRGSETVGGRL
jgi:hypothetical protein